MNDGSPPPGRQHAELTVPPDARGRWRVRTELAAYDLDLDARTVCRTPQAVVFDADSPANVADLRRDGEHITLVALMHCRVGEPMLLALNLREDGRLTFRVTTPVLLIHRTDSMPGRDGASLPD